jgi:uncharacterized protein (TIGR03663 family)
MKRGWCFPALLGAVAVASALRLGQLDIRPMHCDEAVHASKFGRLLERGEYRYDPQDYHGPTLNYLTLPVAWATSTAQLADATETQLRLVPALAGIALVAATWLLRDLVGDLAAVFAAMFCAVSPAMVFYSRYYIQEILLVLFTFGAMAALLRLSRLGDVSAGVSADAARSRRPRNGHFVAWLVACGACIGLMHASKETFVIPVAAMGVAAAATLPPLRRAGPARLAKAGALVAVVGLGTSSLFHSSFLTNPQGAIDSLATYLVYFQRAAGDGGAAAHVHSGDYYFRVLFWWHSDGGAVWTEVAVLVLATIGGVAAATGRDIAPAHRSAALFVAAFTVLTAAAYSAFPYKTPWCALGFLHGTILLAGVGAAAFCRSMTSRAGRLLAGALILAALGHLAWQAWRASFPACADPTNPYVYAHTTPDVPELARRVKQLAGVHPDRAAMRVQVVCPADDYWPLPWYLRDMTRVSWCSQVPGGSPAPLLITQPSLENDLAEYAMASQPPGERYLYVPLRPGPPQRDWLLRPDVPLSVFLRFDLAEAATDEPP